MSDEGTQPLHGPAWWRDNGRPRAHRQDAPFFYGMEPKQYRREKALEALGGPSPIDKYREGGPYSGTRPHTRQPHINWRGEVVHRSPRRSLRTHTRDSRAALARQGYTMGKREENAIREMHMERGRMYAKHRRAKTNNVLQMMGLRKPGPWIKGKREQ